MRVELEAFIKKLETMKSKLESKLNGDRVPINYNDLESVIDLGPHFKVDTYFYYKPTIIVTDKVREEEHVFNVSAPIVSLDYSEKEIAKSIHAYNGNGKEELLRSINKYYMGVNAIQSLFEAKGLSYEALFECRIAIIKCMEDLARFEHKNLSIYVKDLIYNAEHLKKIKIEIDYNPRKVLECSIEKRYHKGDLEELIYWLYCKIHTTAKAIEFGDNPLFSFDESYIKDIDIAIRELKNETRKTRNPRIRVR